MSPRCERAGDDLGDRLEPHRPTLHFPCHERGFCQRPGNDEIDLADVLESEFLKVKPIAQIVSRRYVEVQAASGRVDKPEQLRVIEKNIDIMAFAMGDLDHHGCAAAKRPFEVVTTHLCAELVDEVDCDAEKLSPFGRAPGFAFGHYAASG
ncbi:MAG: hypothetical protein J0I58_26260 [Mesorhizobium sp.]|nr:hypothetical protein [Mesorhizobium sp.]MBN9237306.1 hypothetical protein [Mesorhizobium sp.]